MDFHQSPKIGTRLFCSPATSPGTRRTGGGNYRVSGGLTNGDVITDRSFWIGVYPGVTSEMIDYMIGAIREFVAQPH